MKEFSSVVNSIISRISLYYAKEDCIKERILDKSNSLSFYRKLGLNRECDTEMDRIVALHNELDEHCREWRNIAMDIAILPKEYRVIIYKHMVKKRTRQL